jgi:hypothetical protein
MERQHRCRFGGKNMALLLIILLILLVGGAGLLGFIVKSFVAAGLLGILALALLVWLLVGPARA